MGSVGSDPIRSSIFPELVNFIRLGVRNDIERISDKQSLDGEYWAVAGPGH